MKFLKVQASFVIPVLALWGLGIYIHHQGLELFTHYWPVSLLMVFGSFIAGASSEGGGAIAFPGLTLLFHTPPEIARNFSLAIQSVGMTAASIVIWRLKIPIAKKAILYASIGGLLGILFGTFLVAPFIPPKPAKLFFVSLWLSFGFALWLINRDKEREIFLSLKNLSNFDKYKLVFVGGIGGIITSIFGSGIDILTFCLLTLHFKINEKVATPSSVVLMTFNTIMGFLIHLFLAQDFGETELDYWLVSIPVVIIFAPLGAYIISRLSRNFIANILYVIILVQYVGALFILKPDFTLVIFSILILILGSVIFWLIAQSPPPVNQRQTDA